MRKKRRIMWAIIAVVAAAAFVLAVLPAPVTPGGRGAHLAVKVALVLAVGVLSLLLLRCPHCGAHLGRHRPPPDGYCPHCGKKLKE